MRILSAIILSLLAGSTFAQTVRVKDLARLEGVRANQLVGYGLVVGLDGTGDSKQTLFTVQSTVSMLNRMGVTVPNGQVNLKNVAAVMVTADLVAFARNGDRIDVTVSSLGDARTLQGGVLLQTPLNGADGGTYAVAQGAVSIGGFSAGGGGSTTVKNHPTVGRIPNGAMVEKEVPMSISEDNHLVLSLSRADFTSAARIAKAIEVSTGATATAEDAGRVKVDIPAKWRGNPVPFVAQVDDVSVDVEPVSKVVINERTGTIVIGGAVRLSPVAVAHAGLTVSVKTTPVVSQPAPLSKNGTTVIVPKTKTTVSEPPANTVLIDGGDTVEDLIRALNAIKATPRDIIAIIQAIKEAGGLQAELEVL
ncbi:MAG TPA: flagellar basal body P-ring protein FlgI [Armatimonadota bacterium]|jgi:flagellar P-ring protein precursor FlgI